MNLQIGDKVRFLNDVGGGTISAFLDEKTIEVQTDDGFEIPVPANEVILETPANFDRAEAQSAERNQARGLNEKLLKPEIKPADYKYKNFSGSIYLAVVPENDHLLHVSDLKLYLINDSNYIFQYMVSQSDSPVSELVSTGVVEPETKLEIRKYTQSGLAKIKQFRMQGIFYKEGLFDNQKAFDKEFQIGGLSFYKAATFEENDFFKGKAYIFDQQKVDLKDAVEALSQSELFVVKEEKSKPEKKQITKRVPDGPEEVDLHIESIVDDFAGLSNGKIVEIQMGRFETALETALRASTPKIVFIHGVGNGRLKQELRKKLDRKYPDLKYQDASFKEYGYGATIIWLK